MPYRIRKYRVEPEHNAWQVRYYDTETSLWFTFGDPQPTYADADAKRCGAETVDAINVALSAFTDHADRTHLPTSETLRGLPTLSQSQADDLKVSECDWRVWLSRCGLADGEPFEETVTIEYRTNEGWSTCEQYDGTNPTTEGV